MCSHSVKSSGRFCSYTVRRNSMIGLISDNNNNNYYYYYYYYY